MFENDPAPRKPKESAVEKGFVKWCKEKGIRQRKLVIFGQRSYPDRTVFLGNGRTCCIEFKRQLSPTRRSKTTPGQDQLIKELREDGIPVLVTADLAEAIRFVEELRG